MATVILTIIIMFFVAIIFPELYILLFLLLYGIGEFILRLFGKSFEDKK